MDNPHPDKLEEGWIPDLVDAVKEIFSKGVTLIRRVREKYLLIRDGSATVVDYENLPEERRQDHRFDDKEQALSRGGSEALQNSRYDTYSGQSPEKIAGRASENPYILSDILDEPGLVEAGGTTEAVAKVAEQNPSWAKISDAVEAHGLEADADGNVSRAGSEDVSADASTGDGSTGVAEAASEAASFNGNDSTADSGDLGPTGADGYSGLGGDVGSGSGGSGGGDSGGLGGDVGGDGL